MKQYEQSGSATKRALATIRAEGGIIRTSRARALGIHQRTLYHLRDMGALEQLSRGQFRIANTPAEHPDFLRVVTRIPRAVICLVSALSFHQITTEIPHAVSIALRPGTESPRLEYPPLMVYRFSPRSLSSGVETHRIDGIDVRVFSPEKTIADCFKFRGGLGMEIVLEALQLYRARRKFNSTKLLEYARVCRVERVMRPYLELLS